MTPKISSIPTRKEPLYHNCYLQAPDGETLCTCDRKKAEWYIAKGLGIKVEDSPFTVKLNFEPSGRASGEVGQYYTQIKVNQCVVCGAEDKFIKKNVVPREYRKYFPRKTIIFRKLNDKKIFNYVLIRVIIYLFFFFSVIMKAHQSHDVLLLCPICHEISNQSDLQLRRQLAILCDAPLTKPVSQAKNESQQRRKNFLSAVNALKVNGPLIPLHRRKELESRVFEFAGQKSMSYNQPKFKEILYTDELVTSTSHQEMKCQPHGSKVCASLYLLNK